MPHSVGTPGMLAWADGVDVALAGPIARFPIFTPEAYGAVGNGVADDTTAVRAAFTAANALARVGVVSTIHHPGASVILTGTYNLATLAAPIDVLCNILESRAVFVVPAAYAGVAVRVGDLTSGGYFMTASIHLPDVVKPTSSAIVAGSVAVRVQNFGNSDLYFGRQLYFETAQHYTGWNQGAVYLNVNPGYISYCKVAFLIKPDLAGGWANQINFRGGGVQQSVGYAGGIRQTGWSHVVIDGNGINDVDQITFSDTSFEGDVSRNAVTIARAHSINFRNCRHEQGTVGAAVTFAASANVTYTAHGLTVGDMVGFTYTTAPGGLYQSSPYYVIAVIDANTITIAQKKAGPATVFTSAGTGVLVFRPPRFLLDSSVNLSNIQIENPWTRLGMLEIIDTPGVSGAAVQSPISRTMDVYLPDDLPVYRFRNRFANTSRPLVAAYPATVDPNLDPRGWTAALSDRGIVFAAAGVETGVLTNSGGVLSYRRPADSVAFEVASCRRAPAPITITALSCPAATTTTTAITVTGAVSGGYGDFSVVNPVTALPNGLSIAYARISAADTVTIGFYNATGATISLTVDVIAIVIRRFF